MQANRKQEIGDPETPDDAESPLEFLQQFLSPERLALLEEKLNERTRFLTVVLEDIEKTQNTSAVLRSCDCFGIQDAHVISNDHPFKVHRDITAGAAQWMTIHTYREHEDNTSACFEHLRSQGYQIVATSPSEDGPVCSLPEFRLEAKTAVVLGTEFAGLSQSALQQADVRLQIPMFGFTRSFNISVAAAICLYDLTHKLRSSELDWRLTDAEKKALRFPWTQHSVRRADRLLAAHRRRCSGS